MSCKHLTEPFGVELHLLLPGELLTELVNYYFGEAQWCQGCQNG